MGNGERRICAKEKDYPEQSSACLRSSPGHTQTQRRRQYRLVQSERRTTAASRNTDPRRMVTHRPLNAINPRLQSALVRVTTLIPFFGRNDNTGSSSTLCSGSSENRKR